MIRPKFPRCWRPMAKGADVVIASRFRRGATVRGVPLLRRLTALGAVTLVQIDSPGARRLGLHLRLPRLPHRSCCRTPQSAFAAGLVEESGFACMVEALLKLNASGARCAEVGLHLRYDLKPTASKMAVSSNMRRLLALLVRWRWRGFDAA